MMAVTMLTGLAMTVVLGTMTETAIAGSYGEATAAFHAAEAAVEFAVSELVGADWAAVTAADTVSAFIDGPPEGTRRIGAAVVDLSQATDDINRVPGTAASYQLYAYGSFADLVSTGSGGSPFYVVVWVGDLTGKEEDEGTPVLGVIGRAYGPSGSRRSIAVSVTREDTIPESIRVLSWAELR